MAAGQIAFATVQTLREISTSTHIARPTENMLASLAARRLESEVTRFTWLSTSGSHLEARDSHLPGQGLAVAKRRLEASRNADRAKEMYTLEESPAAKLRYPVA